MKVLVDFILGLEGNFVTFKRTVADRSLDFQRFFEVLVEELEKEPSKVDTNVDKGELLKKIVWMLGNESVDNSSNEWEGVVEHKIVENFKSQNDSEEHISKQVRSTDLECIWEIIKGYVFVGQEEYSVEDLKESSSELSCGLVDRLVDQNPDESDKRLLHVELPRGKVKEIELEGFSNGNGNEAVSEGEVEGEKENVDVNVGMDGEVDIGAEARRVVGERLVKRCRVVEWKRVSVEGVKVEEKLGAYDEIDVGVKLKVEGEEVEGKVDDEVGKRVGIFDGEETGSNGKRVQFEAEGDVRKRMSFVDVEGGDVRQRSDEKEKLESESATGAVKAQGHAKSKNKGARGNKSVFKVSRVESVQVGDELEIADGRYVESQRGHVVDLSGMVETKEKEISLDIVRGKRRIVERTFQKMEMRRNPLGIKFEMDTKRIEGTAHRSRGDGGVFWKLRMDGVVESKEDELVNIGKRFENSESKSREDRKLIVVKENERDGSLIGHKESLHRVYVTKEKGESKIVQSQRSETVLLKDSIGNTLEKRVSAVIDVGDSIVKKIKVTTFGSDKVRVVFHTEGTEIHDAVRFFSFLPDLRMNLENRGFSSVNFTLFGFDAYGQNSGKFYGNFSESKKYSGTVKKTYAFQASSSSDEFLPDGNISIVNSLV